MSQLRELGQDLWVIEWPHHRMLGLELGLRSTIVRLPDGGLVLLSPGPVGEREAEAIRGLGTVAALVAPNTQHYLYLRMARERFPDAAIFLAPGLREKGQRVPEGEALGETPPALWRGSLEQRLVQGTTFNEVVFHHPATRTLILTDLAFNVRRGGLFTRLAMKLNGGFGRFGPTRLMRSMINDSAAFGRSIEQICAWDFDRIVVAHGDVLETGGEEAMRRAFAFVEAPAAG